MQRSAIFSLKYFRKDDAKVAEEVKVGRTQADLRERRVSRVDHNFLGLSLLSIMSFRKYVRRDSVINFVTK